MRGTVQDLATFFEVSLDMLCIRDMDNKLVRVNRAWQEVLGYAIEELEGTPMLALIHPDDIAASRGHMDRMIAEDEVRGFINRYRHRDGHYRFLEWRAKRVDDLVFGVARDVTERLAFEREIKDAKLAAEAANRAKSDFLANMSHEIRTPLNGVIGIVDALGQTDLTASQRDMVEMIRSSGETLVRLVSDILDVSKIEAGRLGLETRVFDFRQALDGLFAEHRFRAQEKGLAFFVDYGAAARGTFRGDAVRIKQVLGNLLSNAVKFTGEGWVRVRIDVADAVEADEPSSITFEIRDSGVGFDPKFAAVLFSRFTQADSTITRRFGGSGLGLAICKSLVEIMGGEISAESKPACGSLFRVRLPLVRGQSLEAFDASQAAAVDKDAEDGPLGACDQQPLRVLLAEDHPINQKVIQVFLALFGAQVTTVENGAQALEVLQTDSYDLVLMDMQMPVMDGLTATRAIRHQEELSGRGRMPVIMLTANAMPQHCREALAAGADLHIAKPLTKKTLMAGIEQVLKRRGSADSDVMTVL